MRHAPTGVPGSLVTLLLATAMPLNAQGGAPGAPLGTAHTAVMERVAVDTFLALVPERQASEIEAAALATETVEAEIGRRRAALETQRGSLSALLDEQTGEIERVRDGLRIARELDADSRREALEKELRLRELHRELVLERIEAADLEREAMDRQAQHARALRKQLGLELDLLADRANWRALHGEDAVVSGAAERREELAADIQRRLRSYFEAKRDAARERERLATAERAVDDVRLRMLEIRREMRAD